MSDCPLCGEPVSTAGDHLRMGDGRPTHRECMLRSVMGGIGHLENHEHWCLVMHDPDGGRAYRQSALEVDHWVTEHRGGA